MLNVAKKQLMIRNEEGTRCKQKERDEEKRQKKTMKAAAEAAMTAKKHRITQTQ